MKHTEFIETYPTKYKEGFINPEIQDILRMLDIDEAKFCNALGTNTCMIINEEIITYKHDVELAIRCVVENREKRIGEWD